MSQRQHHAVAQGQRGEQARPHAIFRNVGNAQSLHGARIRGAHRLSVHFQDAAGRRDNAGDDLRQLALAVPRNARDADNFAGMNLEIDIRKLSPAVWTDLEIQRR